MSDMDTNKMGYQSCEVLNNKGHLATSMCTEKVLINSSANQISLLTMEESVPIYYDKEDHGDTEWGKVLEFTTQEEVGLKKIVMGWTMSTMQMQQLA